MGGAPRSAFFRLTALRLGGKLRAKSVSLRYSYRPQTEAGETDWAANPSRHPRGPVFHPPFEARCAPASK